MKIAQYINYNLQKHIDNKSFQKEIWDQTWSNNSFEELKDQLLVNPIYWRLKDLIKREDRILEAGCGFGQWVYQLSGEKFNITGVDFASRTISKLKKQFKNLKFTLADIENLPFRNESFDVYLSFGVIEHFEDGPEKVLAEARRILKKGGLLFLTVPYLNIPRLLKYGFKKNKGQFYQYLYSKNETVSLIKNAGFKISKISYYDFINALKKDFPPIANLLLKIKTSPKRYIVSKTSTAQQKNHAKPNFLVQKFLYKLDSYVILIEAYK